MRWPAIGWLAGTVNDLAGCIENVSLSERLLAEGTNGSASITEQWRRIGVFCAAKTPEPHNGLGSEVEVVRHLMIGTKAVPYRPMINGQISLLDFLYALYK